MVFWEIVAGVLGGIIGGMGSEATVELYKRIIDRTYHTCDQEHMRICV